MEKDYDEEVEEIDDELEQDLTEEELEKEQSTKVRNGQVEFQKVNHSRRAVKKFGRVSDGETTKYVNIALEYFGHRCALSGERFVQFEEKVQRKKSNLSAEHVVALCLGGDDIVSNLVPTVLQYNIMKNGYYLLDYWDKQKDIEGKSLYSPYRLLKLVNYMMKSIETRDLKKVREYRKAIMTPNEIDEFLAEIEKQDELESDNSKKKIHSDTITATTVDEDNKKILTEVPQVEGNIPTQREQQERFRQDEAFMMKIFLADAVGLLKREQELKPIQLKDKNGNEISLQDKLDDMLGKSIDTIHFEIEVRNAILEKLESLGVQDNKYSVANDLLNNTEILELTKDNRDNIDDVVQDYINKQVTRIRDGQILSEEQLKTVISNMPAVLYDEKEMSKIKLWSTYRSNSFEELISRDYTATDTMVDALIVLKTKGIDLSKIIYSSTIEDLIKEKDEEKQIQIIKVLQEILEEITKDWPIGIRLDTQKHNMAQLTNEIENAGIILTLEEQEKILEKEGNAERSERKTREFVQALVVLKTNGIDLSKIAQSDLIENLIKEKDEDNQNKIIKELQEISKEITKDWPIGVRLSHQKKSNMAQLTNEIEKAGIILTLEEQEKILEKEGNAERSERKTREFVQILVVLKTNGIDLSKILQINLIEDLIKEKDEEEQNRIISELQEISEEITKDWPIGVRLNTQKTTNMTKLEKQIKEAGLKEMLSDKERKKILEKEDKKDLSERKIREFVQVLVVLKTNGIDLSKIMVDKSTIEDLIKEKDEEEQNKIIKELQEINTEITQKWKIGERLTNQKMRNIASLKKEIERAGIILTLQEQQKILEKEGNAERSERKTREFVQVLEVLKTKGIDVSKIVYSGTIEDLIEEKEEEEQKRIINELQEISEEITKDWPIGIRLTTQKKKIEQLKKEIKESGLEEMLTDKERKKILGKTAQKKFKETVVEQKNKGELGQNQQIEEVFEETIRQAEQTQENDNSVR